MNNWIHEWMSEGMNEWCELVDEWVNGFGWISGWEWTNEWFE